MRRYIGQTYRINCTGKGLDNNLNIDHVSPDSLIWPSKNIDLSQGGWEKRGGTAKVNSTVISGAPRIMGLFDFLKIGGSQFIVFATADGKIYKTSSVTIKTGLGASKYTHFETFDNLLFICNGYNIPQTWDGAAGTTSNLTNIPTDWTGTNYPSVMVRHGRGNSERMWAFGCLSNPYTIYVTPNGSGTDFSDANVTTFNVDTGDNAGIVASVEYRDHLILFGKRHTYIIDDADTNTQNWGYTAFTREGGAAHQRLVIPTPNDVVVMMEDGEIYSLVAAEEYGDYKAASLTRAKFIDRWIRDNVRLSYIEHFHGVYDPVKRVVRIFIVRKEQTTIDTALVYYIDTKEWMIEDNIVHASGYSASCSSVIKVSPGQYEVYTGNYSGFIWKLDQTAKKDATNGYQCKALTTYIYVDNPRESKLFQKCWLDLAPRVDYDIDIRYFIDVVYTSSVHREGVISDLGTFTLGVTILGTRHLFRVPFNVGRIGEKIQFEFTNSIAEEEFFISQLLIDYKPLGSQLK